MPANGTTVNDFTVDTISFALPISAMVFPFSTRSHIKKMGNIIHCLYEDRVVGSITVECYDEMACGYEQEQAELKLELESLHKGIAKLDAHEQSVREFMAKAKQYVELPKLTPELLRAFIRKVEVYEKEIKSAHICGNPVVIYYKFQMKKPDALTSIFGTHDEDAEKDIPVQK